MVVKEDWPRYTPELSPIENVWALMKRLLRPMKVNPQTLKETVFVWEAIANF